ncbi:spore germination protein [Ureibacillus sinduriensis]|uniref:Spore gernimation protein n=1 Tax=Ureibacillus sinduriensis BLB-1 = JCM 15800 TaxID=1384057 RepID=A0A0A3I2N8_9BACL|nr:spore germination protein [Ureibacillus sinduriensis]KGR76908.1 spore gernimation protein [Ureibacillus sinduriensis BLB-1 = JCM 15800]
MEISGHSIDNFSTSTLKKLFEKSADVVFHEFNFEQNKVLMFKCDGMVDQQMLYTVVLPNIESLYKDKEQLQKKKMETITAKQIEELPLPELTKVTETEQATTEVYSGNVLMYFEESALLYSCNISRKPNRNPEETNMEVLVKGPRDNFIEDLSINIALIRKRLPTNSLCVEKLQIGRRSKTQVAVMYIGDIANKDILAELIEQFQKIDIDIATNATALMEFVNKKNWILPSSNTTGRPDFAIESLIRGRFVILVDGTPYATITPINFFYLLKTSEDNENPILFSSFERMLRLICVIIGITLPAFWLALTLFHQDQLPLQLLATVVIMNRGLPFPAVLEMLILLFLFEMFREAGLRLPTKIGTTVGVVGGLIIGDAAIRAGITSPAMVVIIAVSTIASYTIVNQSLSTIISILRFGFIMITSILGLFGFFVCLFFLILYVANIRIFGTPYLDITSDLSWANIKKALFRRSQSHYNKRPKMLDPEDQSRNREGNS